MCVCFLGVADASWGGWGCSGWLWHLARRGLLDFSFFGAIAAHFGVFTRRGGEGGLRAAWAPANAIFVSCLSSMNFSTAAGGWRHLRWVGRGVAAHAAAAAFSLLTSNVSQHLQHFAAFASCVSFLHVVPFCCFIFVFLAINFSIKQLTTGESNKKRQHVVVVVLAMILA